VKVLLDTNVVLDLLLDRKPHSEAAADLSALAETGALVAYLCATTVTTIHYLVGRALDLGRAHNAVADLMAVFEIAPVNRAVLEAALEAGFHDYQDAVLACAARQVDAGALVTRNVRDFKRSPVTSYEPVEFLRMLAASRR